MDYEGKNKIIYIGTAILFIVFVFMYAVYFFQNKGEKNERKVVSEIVLVKANKTEKMENTIIDSNEIVAEAIFNELTAIKKEEIEKDVTKKVIDQKTVKKASKVNGVKNETDYVPQVVETPIYDQPVEDAVPEVVVQEPVVPEPVAPEPVETMPDVIVDQTVSNSVVEDAPEVTVPIEVNEGGEVE